MSRWGFVLAFLSLPVVLAVYYSYGPMGRGRVERFAARQQLPITTANGGVVIRYLATTRRWRATGLAAGYVVALVVSTLAGGLHVNTLELFAGWFVGALAAEARVAHLGHGERRAATLTVRRPQAYLGRISRAFLPAATVLAVVVAVVTIIEYARGRVFSVSLAVWWFIAALAIAAIVVAVGRIVLRRAQPVAAADLLAADDAIRSRSMHVLAGGGGTLVLYCVLGQLAALREGTPSSRLTELVAVVAGLGIFVVPIVGYHVATLRWRVPRPEPMAGAAS